MAIGNPKKNATFQEEHHLLTGSFWRVSKWNFGNWTASMKVVEAVLCLVIVHIVYDITCPFVISHCANPCAHCYSPDSPSLFTYNIYVCIYVYTCACVFMYLYQRKMIYRTLYIYILYNVYVYDMHLDVYVYVFENDIFIRVYIHTHTCAYAYLYIYIVCMYIYIYICISVWYPGYP
jgi:hypothetical protein